MTAWYHVTEGTTEQRSEVLSRLPYIERLSREEGQRVLAAWTTSWLSSSYDSLDEMPYSLAAPDYPLLQHVADVVETGLGLLEVAGCRWQLQVDVAVFLSVLLLHDIDKPLLYMRDANGKVVRDPRASALPHGVLGAMLLHDLGFRDLTVSIVGTHAADSPMRSLRPEAWLLHYADFFPTDRVLTHVGATPYYAAGGSH